MGLNNIYKYFARSVFLIALATIAVAFLEWCAHFLGASLIGNMYTPGRLIELSAMLLVFVIVILLRQIRDELRTNHNP